MATKFDAGHVCIVGGGISGLTAAHYLSRAGSKVTIIESSSQLGGLGSHFQYGDKSLERFYHCMLPSDKHLLQLLREIGLEKDTYWKNTSFGFMQSGKLFGLNTPLELLKFSPLSFVDRIRVGVTGLWCSMCSSTGLDDITCKDWLTKLSGKRAFESFWKPMLQAKFGDRYHQVPALWFWTRFNREKGAKTERKGYIRGSYKRISDALAQSLRANDVTIKLDSPVKHIVFDDAGRPTLTFENTEQQSFDRIVYTGPIAMLKNLVDIKTIDCDPDRLGAGIDMQGVINAVFMLKRGFTKHYWVAAVDKEVPFQGIVESTTLLEKEETGGVHMIYLMNYVHRTEALFKRSDEDIVADYMDGLKRMFPDLRDDDVVDKFIFRSAYVEPLYTLGYQKRKPPTALIPGRLYLATSAQVYPQVTSWNGSTGLAKQVVQTLLDDAQAESPSRSVIAEVKAAANELQTKVAQ